MNGVTFDHADAKKGMAGSGHDTTIGECRQYMLGITWLSTVGV